MSDTKLLRKANELVQLGKEVEALHIYEELSMKMMTPQSIVSVGRLIKKLRGSEKALAFFNENGDFNRTDINFEVGLIYADHFRNYSTALEYYSIAIDLKATNPWVFVKYGESCYKLKEYDICINRIEAYINAVDNIQKPPQMQLIRLLADCYNSKADVKKSFNYYYEYLKLSPGDTKIYFQISDLLDGLYGHEILSSIRAERNIPKFILKEFIHSDVKWEVLKSSELEENEMCSLRPRVKSMINSGPKVLLDQDVHFSVNSLTFTNQWADFVYSINKAICLSDNDSFSFVSNEQNKVFSDLCTGGYNIIKSGVDLSKPKIINGHVAFLSQYFGAVNYCHWLLDILPRLGLLREAGFDFSDFDYFVFNNYDAPFQKETLNHLGITEEKIIKSSEVPLIQADKVTIPSLNMHPANGGSQQAIRFLKSNYLSDINLNKGKRIYINRKRATKRKVRNEEELETMLEREFGFISIAMDQYNVLQQASIAYHSEIIISPHGAALTNIAFCKPKTKVFELFSPVYGTSSFYTIAQANSLDYYSFIGEDYDDSLLRFDPDQPNNVFGKKDIEINVELLKKGLKQVIYAK